MLSATGPPNLPPSRPHLLTTVGFPILKTLLRQIDAKRTRHGGGVVARDPRAYMPPPHPPPPLPATSPFLFEDVPHDPLPPLGSTCRTSPTWRLQNHQLSNTADPCDSGDFPPEGIDIAAVGAGPRAQPHHTTPQGGAGGGQPHHTTGGGGGQRTPQYSGFEGVPTIDDDDDDDDDHHHHDDDDDNIRGRGHNHTTPQGGEGNSARQRGHNHTRPHHTTGGAEGNSAKQQA